jgi:hypothetical protein
MQGDRPCPGLHNVAHDVTVDSVDTNRTTAVSKSATRRRDPKRRDESVWNHSRNVSQYMGFVNRRPG